MGQKSGTGVLLAIALFKLLKALLLIAVGIGALSLRHDSHLISSLQHLLREFGLYPHHRLVIRALSRISGLDRQRLEQLGIGSFVYAIVFLIEGTGLLLRKRWAEYLTIAVTASFIPFEVYELVRQASALRATGLALNLVIVLYLVARRWLEREPARAQWTA